jgi:phosphoenolpyruvate carboxylase
VRELNNLRPLLPTHKSFLADNPRVHEVLQTFRMAAAVGPDALGAYVISMAHAPSDVLAVELLQKEVGLYTRSLHHIRRRR